MEIGLEFFMGIFIYLKIELPTWDNIVIESPC